MSDAAEAGGMRPGEVGSAGPQVGGTCPDNQGLSAW